MTDNADALKLEITDSAQDYLAELLDKQDDEVLGIRLFITQPGTPKAETCIAYCRDDDKQEDDILVEYAKFNAYFDNRSIPFLEDAFVDYAKDRMGGQLTIKAPNAKMPKVNDDSPIEDRINYILYTEINPGLASHGGEVSLVSVIEHEEQGKVAVLQFGGGCQGCSMVDLTLKEGVEKTLLENVKDLVAVKDATDHTDTSQAYA